MKAKSGCGSTHIMKLQEKDPKRTTAHKKEERHTKQRSEQKHHKPSTSEQKRGDKKREAREKEKRAQEINVRQIYHTILPLFKISQNTYKHQDKK